MKKHLDLAQELRMDSCVILGNVVDSIQAINGQNADKIIGLRVLNSLKTHKQS